MSAAFTPGPWIAPPPSSIVGLGIVGPNGRVIADVSHVAFDLESEQEDIANARLIAAAPELYDGCNAMLGLVQLILGRDDLSAELRGVLTTNHRIAEAEAATAKARGEAA